MKVSWDYGVNKAVRAAAMSVLVGDGIGGHEQEKILEKEFCKYFGRKYAVPISSGTAGLHCALLACGVEQGDEVIAPPNADWAVLYPILYTGAKPVFCDVEDVTMNLDPSKIEDKITAKTRVILAVSTAGHPVDFKPIVKTARKHNLMVVNDLAQALGSKYKGAYSDTFGEISVSSLNNLKHISAQHVGIVSTDSEELATAVRIYSHHGEDWSRHEDPIERYVNPSHQYSERYGYRYGPSELHCAIARVQLKRFVDGPLSPERRRKNADYYTQLLNELLPDIRTPVEENWAYHTYLRYIIRTMNRNNLFRYLRKKKVQASINYAAPLHTYRICTLRWRYCRGMFPVTEMLASEILTLPSWATLTRNQLEYVVRCIVKFFRQQA
jgi:perosamine synthetase